MATTERETVNPVNNEREPRKTTIAKIVKGVRTDLIKLKLITRDSTVIVGWNDIFADLRSARRRDRVLRVQFSSVNPTRLGMVEITGITDINWEELRKARKLVSAGSEKIEDATKIVGSSEILLSRPAITSLLEQLLNPALHVLPKKPVDKKAV